MYKKLSQQTLPRKGGLVRDPGLDPEKTQCRIPLKNKFADKQLKQSPAVKQYKIIQAGTLVKSSIEMYVFMWPIVLGPWVCMFQ
jgi:hypothetical protein